MATRTVLQVGTMKGLYTFESDDRREWRLNDPAIPEWEVSAVLMDPDDPDRILTGTAHYAWGATVRGTTDGGGSWSQVALRPADETAEYPIERIWQLTRGTRPDEVWAGVAQAALFRSGDGGESWTEIDALTSHPSRPHWNPGAGGLCLHTILIDPDDPDRMWVGISAVGVFATADGGKTWEPMNAGLPAMVMTGSPDENAAYCVHKLVRDAPNGRLFLQFHAHDFTPDRTPSSGVFRKADTDDAWEAIDEDIPQKFGFPMVLSERGELFVMPLAADQNRVFDHGRSEVWRSTDAGESWRALGVDSEPVYSGVLRDAMALDGEDPTGVYFGTTGGDVYASADAGESWERLPARLPRVLCVRAHTYA